MMRLHIRAIGRLKSGPEKELMAAYPPRIAALGRTAGLGPLTILDAPESNADMESRWLAEHMPAGAFGILLDEHGPSLTSEAFARMLATRRDAGCADLVFLIGGPDGHGAAARSTAQGALSLGAMTWPHRLARVMIVEQIYRAVTILVNHPYHRA